MMTLGLGERHGLSGWQGGGGGGKQPSAEEASLLLDRVARRTRCLGCRRGVSVVLPVTGSAGRARSQSGYSMFRRGDVGGGEKKVR